MNERPPVAKANGHWPPDLPTAIVAWLDGRLSVDELPRIARDALSDGFISSSLSRLAAVNTIVDVGSAWDLWSRALSELGWRAPAGSAVDPRIEAVRSIQREIGTAMSKPRQPTEDEGEWWAARIPDTAPVEAPRWLVLQRVPNGGGWKLHQPDEREGVVWDNWYTTRDEALRAAADDFALGPDAWRRISRLGDWPSGPGWPPQGWLPRRRLGGPSDDAF